MKRILLLLILLLAIKQVPAQETIKPLKVGDNIPNLELRQVLNYADTTLKISQLRGKAILIDFWGTWCIPCVNAIPNLQRIQDKFKDSLVIITISSEKTETVWSFLSKLKGPKLIAATGDNLKWGKYFPHSVVPHEIWIDKKGTVKAITDDKEITEANIQKLINGGLLNLKIKDDNRTQNPIGTSSTTGLDESFISVMKGKNITGIDYFSAFTRYRPGELNRAITGPKYNNGYLLKNRYFYAWNLQPLVLYKMAYGFATTREFWSAARVIIEIGDSAKRERFVKNYKATDTTLICYSLLIPDNYTTTLYKKMQSDLTDYFGVKGYFETRNLQCYMLTVTDARKLKTTGKPPVVEKSALFYKAVNTTLQQFVESLSDINENRGGAVYRDRKIIVDGTNWTNKVDLDIASDMKDITALNNELDHYGLKLLKTIRPIMVLVLSDNLRSSTGMQ